jgi:AraC-like DNA-binding protein
VNSYNQWDNVPAESFVNGKAMHLPDGSIAMQMLDHVIEFNPAHMRTVSKIENFDVFPKLVRVMVNGNNLHQGEELDGKVILEKAIPRTSEINLSYNQNSVTLTFSALNYFRPQQTCYRVRIRGLDDTWRVMTTYNSGGKVDSRGNLHLPMVALQPGTYTVEVQTSMIPDVWDSEPYVWIVNVNEPWWRTTGVTLLFGLLLLILLGVNAYYFMKNVSMRAKRNLQEHGIVRQVLNFAEHCGNEDAVLLEPVPDEYGVDEQAIHQNDLTPEFIAMMEKIIPTLMEKKSGRITMRDLSAAAGMELQPFYQLVLGNIFKSHRPLAKSMMLKKAVGMLTTTEKDLEQIAKECGFVSTNYFIGIFYHQYRMTPEIYRRQNSKLRRRQ